MSIVPQLNPVMHAPARLQIAAVLARAEEVEFSVIRDVILVSDSVLSKHLSALCEEGFVELEKAPRAGRQRTWAKLTIDGRRAFKGHMEAVSQLVIAAETAVAAD